MYGLVSVPEAGIYEEPGRSAGLADEAVYGTYVDIMAEKNGYFRIKTFYDYEGYIRKTEVLASKSKLNYQHVYNGMITQPFADVYTEPSFRSKPVVTLPFGSALSVLPVKVVNGFHAVELVNQKTGFVNELSFRYRRISKSSEDEDTLRAQIVRNATVFLHSQYRYGGKTVHGIDCSGLCSMAYLAENIVIWRDAVYTDAILNRYRMRKISLEELKPADLIYSEGHVMMYIGNNRFIHSSMTNAGVAVNSLNEKDKDYNEIFTKKIAGCATIF